MNHVKNVFGAKQELLITYKCQVSTAYSKKAVKKKQRCPVHCLTIAMVNITKYYHNHKAWHKWRPNLTQFIYILWNLQILETWTYGFQKSWPRDNIKQESVLNFNSSLLTRLAAVSIYQYVTALQHGFN